MEYPLTLQDFRNLRKTQCLNPYSNGIPSDLNELGVGTKVSPVLILILMEYPLTIKGGVSLSNSSLS